MIETILILVFSLALFVYWFRYTVLLLLNDEQVQASGTIAGQLQLSETRAALQQAQDDLTLDRLRLALESDYRMLRYLLDHAAGLGLRPLDRYLMALDYRLMDTWYRFSRNRKALQEMAGVLTYIAYKMSERTLRPGEA